MKHSLALLALAGIVGCAGPPPPPGASQAVTGEWGGSHIGMVLTRDGGRIEYDCAIGSIDGSVLTDAAGRFAATGRHTPAQGGPHRIGHVPPSWPARYTGNVGGDTMTLRVEVPDLAITIGPTRLRRGAPAILTRCL